MKANNGNTYAIAFWLTGIMAAIFISGCTTSGTRLPVSEGIAVLSSDNVQNIEVSLNSFFFKPNRITVTVGIP